MERKKKKHKGKKGLAQSHEIIPHIPIFIFLQKKKRCPNNLLQIYLNTSSTT